MVDILLAIVDFIPVGLFLAASIILQRDLYAASKMLFCYVKKEKKTYVNKQGEEKEKIVDVWYFNQNKYEKFFDNIFYPAQEKYLKVLQEQLQNGVKLSGTIFG